MSFWPPTKKVVKDSSIVLVVLDARMPELSRNKELERIIKKNGKPIIYVYNKIDLLSKESLDELKKKYKKGFFVSGTKNIGIGNLKTRLLIELKRMKKEEGEVGIVGYPNMGKSAIINALSKRAKAKVAKKAGTTKGIQWVKAGSLKVIDSPGVIPLEDNALKVALIGSKDPERLRDPERVALEIIDIFLKTNPGNLEKKYGIKIEKKDDGYDLLEKIGTEKGHLKKGGIVDERRVALLIVREWQKGKLSL